jgi:1,4-alpha-glucan branching enzyme
MTIAAALVIAFVSSLVTLGVLKASSTVSIRFVLSAPEARSVTLVADFNNWSPEGYSLSRSHESGDWELVVPLRKGRSYVYNFVIDGEEWLPDPSAQGTIDDGLGGQASYISL